MNRQKSLMQSAGAFLIAVFLASIIMAAAVPGYLNDFTGTVAVVSLCVGFALAVRGSRDCPLPPPPPSSK